MKSVYDIILRPVITERSMQGIADKVYVFEVARDANKVEIKRAVEEIFGVKVASVNTLHMLGKNRRRGMTVGRTPAWKKAYVKLQQDSKSIEFFDTMI
jgi:large subunit ribosomal protein L23